VFFFSEITLILNNRFFKKKQLFIRKFWLEFKNVMHVFERFISAILYEFIYF